MSLVGPGWLAAWRASSAAWGDRPAVLSQGERMSHAELHDRAADLARSLHAQGVRPGDRVGVLGARRVDDFVHILAIWWAGAAYVPLNPKFPVERLARIARAAGLSGVLLGAGPAVRQRAEAMGVLDMAAQTGSWVPVLAQVAPGEPVPDLAYLIFTSGTTGDPKGVPITFGNLAAYVANLRSLYPLTPEDVVLQGSELSFDLSVLEVWVSLCQGAALCVVPSNASLLAGRYAQDQGVTVWVSVPSTVLLASQAKALPAASLPALRLALFCGEALTAQAVEAVHAAAPSARVVNLWGPTEATVSFTHYPVDRGQPLHDVTPIGWPHGDQHLAIWDDQGQPLPAGQLGELVQAGSQVCAGYWRDADRTAEHFSDADGRRWYRTGDLARFDPRVGYLYAGRADRQIKLKGYRIELQECEAAIRRVSGRPLVCVLPEPEAQPQRLVACLEGDLGDTRAWALALGEVLPAYMLPERWVSLPQFPLNDNGKVDVRGVRERLRAAG